MRLRVCFVRVVLCQAETVTGIADPIQSARSLLNAKGSKVEWVVLKVGAEGCYIATRETVLHHPAMKVTISSLACFYGWIPHAD